MRKKRWKHKKERTKPVGTDDGQDKKRSKEEWIGRVEGIRLAKLSIRIRHGSYVIQ